MSVVRIAHVTLKTSTFSVKDSAKTLSNMYICSAVTPKHDKDIKIIYSLDEKGRKLDRATMKSDANELVPIQLGRFYGVLLPSCIRL